MIYEIAACTMLEASPEYIWEVLDDIAGWKEWMPATKNLHIDLLTPGPAREGYRFRLRGGVVHATMEVTGYTPLERTIKFHLNLPPVNGTTRCLLTPLDDERCHMERIDQLELPGPMVKFLDATQRKRFETLAADFLKSLKQTVVQKARYAEAAA